MEIAQSSIYSRALAEARDELLALTHEIEALSKRKAQVEAVIVNLEPLLPQAKPTLRFPAQETSVASNSLMPQPIWKSILLSINGKGEAFTVKDAIQGLERIGRPIESPNRFQIVRAVLTKKTENFEVVSPGVFRVKGREKEASSEEKAS